MIGTLIYNIPGKCRTISLKKIDYALIMQNESILETTTNFTRHKFEVQIETEPNRAIFGALLHRQKNDTNWQIAGEIQRLSAYGNS